ncbi:hypothetical protein [Amorphus orientalis]|uniref:Uncharacterized protein n=1 Tax=Amorphus orientalis TaxID=649198 RepID=A0AAE3VMM6_9HYPH|nr:hypothetical protein [Amorphus orientalis]MDQ0314837.1 hypothetical protein [Amorphus orientalis]
MAKSRRKRKVTLPPVTAAERGLVMEAVEGGYESGGVERRQRRCAAIDTMRRKRQITERQFDAANRLREAASAMGLRTVDMTRDIVDQGQGEGPVLAMTLAARDLADARTFLGPDLARMVMKIAVEGASVEDAAIAEYGAGSNGRPTGRAHRATADLIRTALDSLADLWWPQRQYGIRGAMEEGARPTLGIVEDVENASE